jgi:hypothetical protein
VGAQHQQHGPVAGAGLIGLGSLEEGEFDVRISEAAVETELAVVHRHGHLCFADRPGALIHTGDPVTEPGRSVRTSKRDRLTASRSERVAGRSSEYPLGATVYSESGRTID